MVCIALKDQYDLISIMVPLEVVTNIMSIVYMLVDKVFNFRNCLATKNCVLCIVSLTVKEWYLYWPYVFEIKCKLDLYMNVLD